MNVKIVFSNKKEDEEFSFPLDGMDKVSIKSVLLNLVDKSQTLKDVPNNKNTIVSM